MKEKHYITEFKPHKAVAAQALVREGDVKLTPKAEAKAANKLPKAEQLNKFESELESKDNGNQPS